MKIGYIETFPVIGLERWRKIPLEVEVKEEIDFLNATYEEIEAFMLKVRRVQYALKKQVQSFYYESLNAESKAAAEKEQVKEIQVEPQSQEAKIIADIYTCTELKVIQSYELIAKKYPNIQAAYDQQLKKLEGLKNSL